MFHGGRPRRANAGKSALWEEATALVGAWARLESRRVAPGREASTARAPQTAVRAHHGEDAGRRGERGLKRGSHLGCRSLIP